MLEYLLNTLHIQKILNIKLLLKTMGMQYYYKFKHKS